MTSKEQILADVKEAVARGDVSKSDLLAAAGFGGQEVVVEATAKKTMHIDMSKILYGIGGLIVVIGLLFLIQQMWNSFGAGAQIMVTLGSAMAIYISAVLLHQYKSFRTVALVLFVVAGVLMPVGIFVTLDNLSPGGNAWLGQLIIAGIPALVYFGTYSLYRHKLQLFIGVLFLTWTVYALVGLMLDGTTISGETVAEIWAYLTLLMGVSYLLLGYWLEGGSKDEDRLVGAFYFLGAGGALGAAYALTYMQDFWILAYFLLVLAAIYLSTFLHSRSLLIFGALGLMGHLTHISFKYFADNYGWPLALIISGFMIIGIGYGTVVLNQKFLGRKVNAVDDPAASAG